MGNQSDDGVDRGAGTASLRAGADARPIAPTLDRPVFLAGFSRNRRATGAHDDLMVRTLALSDGDATLILAECDLLGLARVDTRDIRARLALPSSHNVVIACTHTHSGEDTIGLWGPDAATAGFAEAYVERVKGAVVDSIRAALARLRPAQVRAAMASAPGIVKNYRDPEIVDHELAALQAYDDAGGIFTLLSFPCHPEVLDDDNTLLSADMAGCAARALERGLGGVGIWASGHLGGMMSPDTAVRTFGEAERMGEALAAAALDALRVSTPAREIDLGFATRSIAIPLRNPLLQMAAAAGLLRGQIGDGAVETEVSAWRIGELAQCAFVPGELLPKLGLRLKARMRAPGKFVVGLANDEIGYILPREDFVFPADYLNPGRQYEESMALGPEAGDAVVDALEGMLQG